MALGFDFNPQFLEVQRAFDGNRRVDAIRLAQQHLRNGYHSPQFLRLVADLLDPPVDRGRGRPKQAPKRWLEIGEAFYRFRVDDGMTYDAALNALTERENASLGTIRRAIKFFDDARAADAEFERREQEWTGIVKK